MHFQSPVVPIRHSRAKTLQNIPDLMASMSQLDEDSVQRIRKTAETPPRVSVIDMLQAVTCYSDDQSRALYRKLVEAYPEIGASCTYFKFPGRRQRDTVVTDAEGIAHIIMILPGKAASNVRQAAADMVVRRVNGNVFPVQEQMQAEGPEHPVQAEEPAATIVGQSVPALTPYEMRRAEREMAKNARMQALSAAFQLAQAIDST